MCAAAAENGDGAVVLRTYRTDREFWAAEGSAGYPVEWHRMIVARVASALAREGQTARIEYAAENGVPGGASRPVSTNVPSAPMPPPAPCHAMLDLTI